MPIEVTVDTSSLPRWVYEMKGVYNMILFWYCNKKNRNRKNGHTYMPITLWPLSLLTNDDKYLIMKA